MTAVADDAMAVRRQHGALLVEALVAIAVFSVGVLGNVTLHAHAIRHVGEAHYRGEAMRLAQALVARMRAEDPATLAARYDAQPGNAGYDTFALLARRLPGATSGANAPEVRIGPGPSAASRRVTIVLHWQLPGERNAHNLATTAVIAGN